MFTARGPKSDLLKLWKEVVTMVCLFNISIHDSLVLASFEIENSLHHQKTLHLKTMTT